MSILDTVNARFSVQKKAQEASISPLEQMGRVIKTDIKLSNSVVVAKNWADYDAKHGGHKPAQYHPSNPKIDLHHKETGDYLGSTNWSPTVGHAVANYEEKYPHLNGKVRGFKAKKEEQVQKNWDDWNAKKAANSKFVTDHQMSAHWHKQQADALESSNGSKTLIAAHRKAQDAHANAATSMNSESANSSKLSRDARKASVEAQRTI